MIQFRRSTPTASHVPAITGRHLFVLIGFFFFLSACTNACVAAVRVDLGDDTGRKDTRTAGWIDWQVPDGHQVERNFGNLKVTLRAGKSRDSVLRGAWCKAGLATGATMTTDGAVVEATGAPAVLELELAGLSAGRHTLVTYHNSLGKLPGSTIIVELPNGQVSRRLQPTHRVADNWSSASAYLEFDVEDGKPTIVQLISAGDGPTNQVVLNGFEIDAADPQRKALRPVPADGDWHADADDGEIELGWQAAPSAVRHRLYHATGTDLASAASQLSDDDEATTFVADVDSTSFRLKVAQHNSLIYHCWRVDSIDADGKATQSDVWSFRCRHLAFPSAEGYGRFAIGGRGGRVIKVTNLKDAGPGSLRAALEAEGPRTVIFDVGGRIILKDRLIIRNSFLTIAGHTAPGKGICISNYNLGMLGSHDVIIRYLRVRPGDTSGKTLDGMGMASSDHCIIDHCSVSWTQDEAFSSRGAKNITLQWTLISEALNIAGHKKYKEGTQHGYAASISGDIGSFHHNLLAHCAGRNWSLAGGLDQASRHAGRLDIRNNVVYNWSHRTTDGGAKQVVFVNNYYKPGPATKVLHVLKPEREGVPSYGPQDYYVAGNVLEGRYDQNQDRRAGIRRPRNEKDSDYLYDEPFYPSYVSTESAADAYRSVLTDVGCNRPTLDDHDARILHETTSGTTTFQGSVSGLPGLPDSQNDVGGWEDYPEIHRDADWDSDDDGLPDQWEVAHGLNPNSPEGDLSNSHADPDQDGYTNLEQYLHELGSDRARNARRPGLSR